jgi:hypothetical protein
MRQAAKPQAKAGSTKGPPKGKSLREVYEETCANLKVRPNSTFEEMLPDKPGQVLNTDTLDFSRNYVGDRGMLAVLEIVQRSPQLKRLVVTENGLRNAAIKAIVTVVVKHPGISSLDVSDNYISEGAGKVLEVLLKENPRITELGFSNTKIDVDCRLRLKDLIALNAANARS